MNKPPNAVSSHYGSSRFNDEICVKVYICSLLDTYTLLDIYTLLEQTLHNNLRTFSKGNIKSSLYHF